MVQEVEPLPPPGSSESMGVEGSGSGLGSVKMEANDVKESIGVLEVACVSGFTKSSGGADEHKSPSIARVLCKTKQREESEEYQYGKHCGVLATQSYFIIELLFSCHVRSDSGFRLALTR